MGRRPNWFAQSIDLGSLSSSKEEERKKEEKESSVWKFQDIKVRKNILTLPLFVFFFLVGFEVGLELVLVWVGIV